MSQLVRSPGVYFDRTQDRTSDKDVFGAKIIPSRGAWLEFEIDKRDVLGVRVDRKRKQSAIVFLMAIGMTKPEIAEAFQGYPLVLDALEKSQSTLKMMLLQTCIARFAQQIPQLQTRVAICLNPSTSTQSATIWRALVATRSIASLVWKRITTIAA